MGLDIDNAGTVQAWYYFDAFGTPIQQYTNENGKNNPISGIVRLLLSLNVKIIYIQRRKTIPLDKKHNINIMIAYSMTNMWKNYSRYKHVGNFFIFLLILYWLARSHRALAELKGYADTMPNKNILINAVIINEAKDSSEIENIITTHDDLFRAMAQSGYNSPAAKEVVNYRTALWYGYELVNENQMLTTNMVVEIQGHIEKNRAGIRKLPGTVYTPPSAEQEILNLMSNLELYINEDYDNVDPLVKLAVIHYQFESIHPFYDGNGRTGRIVNVLYLVLKELLDSPILYLSKYIIRNKSAYYTKIKYIEKGLKVSRKTASGYLASLEETGFLTSQMVGKEKVYLNKALFDVVQEVGSGK